MKPMFLIAMSGASCFSQPSPKLVCNAGNQGLFWPEKANTNHGLMRQAFQNGELEMCAAAGWRRYRWRRLSVRIDELAAQAPPGDYREKKGSTTRASN